MVTLDENFTTGGAHRCTLAPLPPPPLPPGELIMRENNIIEEIIGGREAELRGARQYNAARSRSAVRCSFPQG